MKSRLQAAPATAALGILCLIGATACFAVLDTAVKVVGAALSVLVAVWFRYLFQAITVSAVMLPLRGLGLLRTRHPRWQALRGALLVVGHDTGLPGWAAALPLALVLIYAWFQILTARMARTEDPMTMHFYTGWVGALMATALLPLVWQAIPDGRTLALLCLIGLMGTVGHFLLILAFARAPASALSPYLYTQIGFAMLCGWAAFGHAPGPEQLAGILLIAACGATASRLNARPA